MTKMKNQVREKITRRCQNRIFADNINPTLQRTPVNLIGFVQEKNIIIRGLSDYPVTIFY